MSNPDLAARIAQNTEVFRKLVDEREQIIQAIRDYHLAKDEGDFGADARAVLVMKIEEILDMLWVQGAERKRREESK